MKRFFLVIASILFLPTLGLAFLFLNLTHTVLSPDIYKKALIETNTYEKILKIDLSQITKNLLPAEQSTQMTEPLSYLNFQELITKEELQQISEKALDDFFIKVLRQGEKQFAIDLTTIQNNFFEKSNLPIELLPKDFLPKSFTIQIPAPLLLFQPIIAIMPILTYLLFALSLIYLTLIIWLKIGNRSKVRLPTYLIFSLGITYLIFYLNAKFLDPLQFITIESIDLAKIALDLFNNLKMAFIKPYLIEGIILTSTSIIAFAISFFIPKEKPKQQPK